MSSNTTVPRTLHLPDLHALCPFKTSLNPYHREVAAASSQWILSFTAHQGKDVVIYREDGKQQLSAWTFPYAEPEQLRICCDVIHILFQTDDVSDEQNGQDAASTGRAFANAMEDDAFDDGSVICKIAKEYVPGQ